MPPLINQSGLKAQILDHKSNRDCYMMSKRIININIISTARLLPNQQVIVFGISSQCVCCHTVKIKVLQALKTITQLC